MVVGSIVLGPRKSSLTRKGEFGHRIYKATWVVAHSSTQFGPADAILCPGLPQYGDTWAYGVETDPWAWCRYETEVEQLFPENMAGQHWACTFTFSTEPDSKGCVEQQIQNPLLQPPKLSGNFSKFREEATEDRFGKPVVNSAWEQIRGPQVEFDDARPVIKIEMNVANLNLPLLYSMRECVNAFPMWGLPPRCVKLSNISWSRLFYGTCFVYYSWNLEFECNTKTWDKQVMDEGTKVLYGDWDTTPGSPTLGQWVVKPFPGYVPDPGPPVGPNPDPSIPGHFKRFQDISGNYVKVPLNGQGLPATGKTVGYGASAVAVLNPLAMPLASTSFVGTVTIINGGLNYTTPPKVVFSPGVLGFPPATGTAVVTNGSVTAVNVTDGGTYFYYDSTSTFPTGPPTITFVPVAPSVGQITVQKYREADFMLLGLPSQF